MNEPRYVIRPASSSTHREMEIFDNQERETIGSFKERKGGAAEVIAGYAEELVKRLNAEHGLALAADLARRQLWAAFQALPDDETVKKFADLQRGRSIYLPELEKTAETTS
jgi:hypothetical protein